MGDNGFLVQQNKRLQLTVDRLAACVRAFVDDPDVDPATLTRDQATAIRDQWEVDWARAAKDAADAENLRGEVQRLTVERDALLSLQVGPWPAGGWMARLPWCREGYPGGEFCDGAGAGGPIGYWFEKGEDAEAAVIGVARGKTARSMIGNHWKMRRPMVDHEHTVSWFCNRCGCVGTAPVPPPGDDEARRLAAIDHHDQAGPCGYLPVIVPASQGGTDHVGPATSPASATPSTGMPTSLPTVVGGDDDTAMSTLIGPEEFDAP